MDLIRYEITCKLGYKVELFVKVCKAERIVNKRRVKRSVCTVHFIEYTVSLHAVHHTAYVVR